MMMVQREPLWMMQDRYYKTLPRSCSPMRRSLLILVALVLAVKYGKSSAERTQSLSLEQGDDPQSASPLTTSRPTAAPTTREEDNVPSFRPSDVPTMIPSDYPSSIPSFVPSDLFTFEPTPIDPNILDVLIIGAGWAGLGAGDYLLSQHVENFEILEARDSVGGRSRTVYEFTDNLAVELGSAWTYRTDNEVHDLVLANNIPFGRIDYNYSLTFGLYQESTGGLDDAERNRLINNEWYGFTRYSQQEVQELEEQNSDVPFETIVDAYIQQEGYEIEIEYTSPLSDISTTRVGSNLGGCIFCGAIYYIPVENGGFDKIFKPLSDPLQSRTRKNHVVKKIEYSEDNNDDQPLRVTYTDLTTGSTRIKLAKTVLVTAPLGVLKASSIEFIPSLPQQKQDAIDFLGFGVLNKCIFYWEKTADAFFSWWPDGKHWLTLITDSDATWTTFFNDKEIGNNGHFVLSAWVGGDNALAIEQQTDQAIVSQVLNNLRKMLGEEVPEPAKYVISRWGQDEFARGSYSFPTPGQSGRVDDARRDLGEPVGERLFWAGEATSVEWYGTTIGALRSGRVAASDIHDFLRK